MRKINHSKLMEFICIFIRDKNEIAIDDVYNMKLMFDILGITKYSLYINYIQLNEAHSARVEYKLSKSGKIKINISFRGVYDTSDYVSKINIALYPKLDGSADKVKYKLHQNPERRKLYKDNIIRGVIRAFYGIFTYYMVPDINAIKIKYDDAGYIINAEDYYDPWIVYGYC